jgi:Carboxypeptidase regulatory-like domain
VTPIFKILAIFFTMQAGEQIRGIVVNPIGASVGGTLIGVLEPESRMTLATANADPTGAFQIAVPTPGSYTLTLQKAGFRTAVISVVVRGAEITDLAKIPLDLGGCDMPGVMCDTFGMADLSEGITSHRRLKVNLDCGLDLSKGRLYCPAGKQPADLKITRDGVGIFVSPLNGAALSENCKQFKKDRVRVDGLGINYDVCVHTRDGHLSQVFLEDVEPRTSEITLQYVTRRQ